MLKLIKRNPEIILLSLNIVTAVVTIFTFSSGINKCDIYDYLEGVKWAQATIDSGWFPLSKSISYSYTIPFGSNYLIAPFLLVFKENHLLANQMGMFVWFLIYLSSLHYLSLLLFDEFQKRIIFLGISTIYVYTYIGNNMLHHLLFYGIGAVCFNFLLGSLVKIAKGTNKKIDKLILYLFSFYSAMNGVATIAIGLAPVVFSILYQIIVKKDKKMLKILIKILACVLFGYALYKIANFGINPYDGVESRFILRTTSEHLIDLVKGIIKYPLSIFIFRYQFQSNAFSWIKELNLISFDGLDTTFRILLLFTIVVIFIKISTELFRENNVAKPYLELFVISLYAEIAICLFQFILFTAGSERTFFNIFLSIFMIIALKISNKKIQNPKLWIFFICLITYFAMFTIDNNVKENGKELSRFNKIMSKLEENNIQSGYADYTYFPLNILSNDKIKVYYVLNRYSENEDSIKVYDERASYLNSSSSDSPNEEFVFYITDNLDKTLVSNLEIKELIINDDDKFIFKANQLANIKRN